MMALLPLLGAFVAGLLVGRFWEGRPETEVIERFRGVDQKFYERFCAYQELDRRRKIRAAQTTSQEGLPPATTPAGASPLPAPD